MNNITKKRYVKNAGVMLFPFCPAETSRFEIDTVPIRARLQTRVRVV